MWLDFNKQSSRVGPSLLVNPTISASNEEGLFLFELHCKVINLTRLNYMTIKIVNGVMNLTR